MAKIDFIKSDNNVLSTDSSSDKNNNLKDIVNPRF